MITDLPDRNPMQRQSKWGSEGPAAKDANLEHCDRLRKSRRSSICSFIFYPIFLKSWPGQNTCTLWVDG